MIKTLTSLRFFAALTVFSSHLFILQNFNETKWIFERIFYEGYLGVTFFFILSGFILTYSYYEKFKIFTKETYKNFMVARIARIYPVYILTFSLTLIPYILDHINLNPLLLILTGLINVGMLQSFVPISGVYFSFNSPAWSISNEMFFYLTFPFLIVCINRLSKKYDFKYFSLFAVLFFIIAFTTVWNMRDFSLAHWLFYIFPFFRFIDFFIGVVLGVTFLKCRDKVTLKNKTFTFLELSSVSLLAVAVFFSIYVHPTLRLWGYYLPFLVLIVWVFSFQKGMLSHFLSNNRLVYLGEVSFSFYMIHKIVMGYLENIPVATSNPVIFILASLLITLTLSHLVYKYYEIPLRNKIRHKKILYNQRIKPISKTS